MVGRVGWFVFICLQMSVLFLLFLFVFFFSFFSGDVVCLFTEYFFSNIVNIVFWSLLICICSKNKTNKKDKKTQTKLVIFCKSNFLKMQNSLFSTLVYERRFLFNNIKESTSPWTSNLRLRSLLSTGLFRIK